MARAFNFSPNEYLEPLQNIPGAAGTAQQAQVIIPRGYGEYQDPWSTFATTLMNNLAQQRTQQQQQKQYNEAVKGIGEFWPILQATGVSEGQVNEMLKSGYAPKDIVHYALTQQADRNLKGLEWGHEAATHARDIQEKAFTPDQMDVVDAYKSGKISLSNAMRQSGLTSLQLHNAISEATAGEGLKKSGMTTGKEALELQDLPAKLKVEGKKRILELQKLQDAVDSAPTKEAQDAARLDLEQKRYELEYWKAHNKATTKTLNPELQKSANSIKGLATPQAMYNQMVKLGYQVRKPSKSALDLAGLPTGKDESKDSYFKDVIVPALQNKQLEQPTQNSNNARPATFPKGPYGQMAPKIATSIGLDPNIFGRLIQQESGWNPQAKSSVGAFGLGQFMPGVAKQFGYTDEQVKKDPMLQLGLAAAYLKKKLDEFGGDYAKALAAYNAGSKAVHKYNGVPPYRETQAYVHSILGTNTVRPTSTKRKSLDEIF